MIVVIADDISGATELAGVARCFGLSAEVQTLFDPLSTADVVAIDTNTRSLSPDAAARIVRSVAERVREIAPQWVYKKTDSVLRGNVFAETDEIRRVFAKAKCLFIPANPDRGRIIREGRYFIDEVPLDETAFRRDPEHPARTAQVLELLQVGSECQSLASQWTIPDVVSREELAKHANSMDEHTLPAGAAEFFSVLLECKGHAAGRDSACRVSVTSGKSLFICGSATAWATGRKEQCESHGIPIFEMPDELFSDTDSGVGCVHGAVTPYPAAATRESRAPERDSSESQQRSDLPGDLTAKQRAAVTRWSETVALALQKKSAVMLAIGGGTHCASSSGLLKRLVATVRQVLVDHQPERVYLEGGATAAAVLQELGWQRLRVREPVNFGIASLEVIGCEAPTIFIKPGSYSWPNEVWRETNE